MSYQEFRPSGFNVLPTVTKYILGINVILFALKFFSQGQLPLDEYLNLYYYKSQYFKPYQFITHMFMHGSFFHLLFNMFGVYTFGSILERLWGAKRFLNFYILCGLGAAAAQYATFYYSDTQLLQSVAFLGPDGEYMYKYMIDNMSCLGASGALFGLLGAFAFLFPNTMLGLFLLPPMKAKYFVGIYAAFELFYGYRSTLGGGAGDGIAHFAHIGGLVVGLIIVFIWRKRSNTFY